MMNMKKIFIAAAAALTTIVACQKNEVAAPAADSVLYATIEETDATKTYMDASNNIRWSEGDQVVAFLKTSLGLRYQIKDEYVGKTSGYFSQISSGSSSDLGAGTEWDHNVVYYPYSDAIEAAKSGSNYVLDVVLPSKQTYAAESFGNGSMAMVAVSENNNITFKNILGGMKLQLKGTQKVKSITLKGKNNEKLSGAAVVTVYTDETKPAITMAQSASTSVTLDCGSGVQLNESSATEFIIALPPVVFTKGFTVTVTDTESNTYTVGTDKENEVLRSSLLVMPAVSIGSDQGSEPREGDYVDEYGINHGQGVEIGGVVWAPVNCGYHATDYQYGKLYQWGRKYGQGYDGSLYDASYNVIGTYSDATVPTIVSGPVDLAAGQSKGNENSFYTYDSSPYDWLSPKDDKLWNSGSESNPVKTEYDPCPAGWRVPTYVELDELRRNRSSWTSEGGQPGYWFSGASSYTENVPQVFFPAAGCRNYDGYAYYRGYGGIYWSSSGAYGLYFDYNYARMGSYYRAYGYSVRCVQE